MRRMIRIMVLCAILLLLSACGKVGRVVPATLTSATSQQFSFTFSYGDTISRSVLDTTKGTFTQSMVGGSSITIPLRFTEAEMESIQRKMDEINFCGYPSEFSINNNRSGIIRIPHPTYQFWVKCDGMSKTLRWVHMVVSPETEDSEKLLDLVKMISGFVFFKPEYHRLPEPFRSL
jgi:hypothetical protein